MYMFQKVEVLSFCTLVHTNANNDHKQTNYLTEVDFAFGNDVQSYNPVFTIISFRSVHNIHVTSPSSQRAAAQIEEEREYRTCSKLH